MADKPTKGRGGRPDRDAALKQEVFRLLHEGRADDAREMLADRPDLLKPFGDEYARKAASGFSWRSMVNERNWARARSFISRGRDADARAAVAHSPQLVERLDALFRGRDLKRVERLARMRQMGRGNERHALSELEGKRARFGGTVGAFARKARQPRMLLTEVSTDGKVITDHVWVRVTQEIRAVAPHKGDWLECECIVSAYRKGRGERVRYDWTLCEATKVRVHRRGLQDA
jgi:hypothetical protein